MPLLEVAGLVKLYGATRAVDGVTFHLNSGETLGLVGRSGSGKTTIARLLLHFEKPDAGSIVFGGDDWLGLRGRLLRRRRREIAIVFQDPGSSLDPRRTAGSSVAEPLRFLLGFSRRKAACRAEELLHGVGLDASIAQKFPHELSGGEKQRIAIARAIASEPAVVVCDEAVSALDVSVAAQIENTLRRIQRETGVSYLFISHDLAAVARMSDRIAVMNSGKLVEEGTASQVLDSPADRETARLVASGSVDF